MNRIGSVVLVGLGFLLSTSSVEAEVLALVGDQLIDGLADEARAPAVVVKNGAP